MAGSVSIHLWMSRGCEDVFGLVWTVISEQFTMEEITLGLVKSIGTSGHELKVDMTSQHLSHETYNWSCSVVRNQGAVLAKAAKKATN